MAVNGSLTSWWALEHNELWPELAAADGERFAPPQILIDIAAKGESF